MTHDSAEDTQRIDRRGFLGAGAGAMAVAAALADGTPAVAQAPPDPARATELPKRPLGRTGVQVSMLSLGTWLSPGGERLLRYAWANGIRYVDTAKSYGSEPMIARWLNGMPGPRGDLFLVTKDQPNTPQQLIAQLDQRLEALRTDYVDLIFLHALGDRNFDVEIQWVMSPEFKQVADVIRKSGKAKFVGFSTHHPQRALLLQAAAQGGFVDAIMLQNNPWIAQDDDMNRALDACYKQGIGLISMKQVAGNMNLNEMGMLLPELTQQGSDALPGAVAGDLDRRAVFLGLCLDAEYRSDPSERHGGTSVPTLDHEPDRRPARRLHGCWADAVCLVRWPLQQRCRHKGRAGQPDPVPDLPRPSRAPRRSPAAVRRARPRGTELAWGRP